MTDPGRSPESNRPMARRPEARGTSTGRRVATVVCVAGLAAVALIGTLHPLTAAGGAQPSATDALGAASGVGSVWSAGNSTGGLDWPDLIAKGTIVLALLFITLRVLGRVGGAAPKRGGRLEVLESRSLAPKASLHLVAIGDRRLVVGLTPSGMVSLAELDAAELETEAAAATSAEGTDITAAADTRFGGRDMGRSSQPAAGPTFSSLLGPVDAVTGRLAAFLNGGRMR